MSAAVCYAPQIRMRFLALGDNQHTVAGFSQGGHIAIQSDLPLALPLNSLIMRVQTVAADLSAAGMDQPATAASQQYPVLGGELRQAGAAGQIGRVNPRRMRPFASARMTVLVTRMLPLHRHSFRCGLCRKDS